MCFRIDTILYRPVAQTIRIFTVIEKMAIRPKYELVPFKIRAVV